MKTVLSLAVPAVLMAFGTTSHADVGSSQGEPDSAMSRSTRLGLKAGFNSSTVSSMDSAAGNSYTLTRRMAINAGAFVVRRLDERFGLQIEAGISDKGARIGTADSSATVELRYLALPLLVRYELAPAARSVRPFVAGGAALGVLLSAQVASEDGSLDIGGETETLEVSGVLSAGLEMPQKLGAVHLEVRYSHGITDVVSGSVVGATQTVKNRAASVLVGYVF